MSKIQTEKVSPRSEVKTYEVEVYIAFHKSGMPFATAGITGAPYSPAAPSVSPGGVVKRYVFDVHVPQEINAPTNTTEEGDKT